MFVVSDASSPYILLLTPDSVIKIRREGPGHGHGHAPGLGQGQGSGLRPGSDWDRAISAAITDLIARSPLARSKLTMSAGVMSPPVVLIGFVLEFKFGLVIGFELGLGLGLVLLDVTCLPFAVVVLAQLEHCVHAHI